MDESRPILANTISSLNFDRIGKHARDSRFESFARDEIESSIEQSRAEIELSHGFGRAESFPRAAPGRLIVRRYSNSAYF